MSEEASASGSAGELEESRESVMQAMEEISTSNQKLQEISKYCAENFMSNQEVFQQTQTYAADALLNAAYQAHRGAESIMEFFDAQLKELSSISASVDAISVVRGGV